MNSLYKVMLIALVVAVMMLGSTGAYEVMASEKTADRDRLAAIALDEGFVRVIARLDVPYIKKLTDESTTYKAVAPGQVFSQEAFKADAVLSARITSISEKVIFRLQSNYVSYQINHTYNTVPLLALDVSVEALSILESAAEVISITEDKPIPPVLDNTIGIIGADIAWGGTDCAGSGCTGLGWYVAVLDTGIRSSHDFFSGKTILEACYSANGDCPGSLTEMIGAGAAAHHPPTYYGWDHGTHVSGIATGNNGSLFGVAKDADIIAVQVFSQFSGAICSPNADCVLSYTSDQIKGLEYVYSIRGTYNIASVNMSLGGGKYASESTCDSANANIKTAIDNLRAADIATIIASGNNGYCDGISAPGCVSSAIAVGAVTDSDAEASFNNWHIDLMDLWAPGVLINSSTGDSDSSYGNKSGTSMAAPHVAGTWAILRQQNPGLSVSSLLTTLSGTGVSVTTACPDSGSKSRIQVDSALNSMTSPIPTAPTALAATTISDSQIDLSWTDNSTDETGSKIERKTGSGGNYSQIATVNANVTSYSDTSLSEATTYYYRVRAYNTSGDSSYASEASTLTLPAAPNSLSASTISVSQVNISWTDNSSGETGFKIERKTGSGGTYSQITTVSADVTSYSNTSLSSSTTYYYRVRAYHTQGNSSYASESSATTSSPSGGDGGGGGDGNCFIATAAFGSYLDPHVMVLRKFRDDYLLNNTPGRILVKFYYKTSPPIAAYISKHKQLRTATRLALTPVVYGVEYPHVTILIFFSLGIGFMVSIRKKRNNCPL